MAIGDKFAERLSILRIEELMWQNVAQFPAAFEQTQAALYKHHVNVIVTLAG